MKMYVIQSFLVHGFWSKDYKAFRGILFATTYNTVEDAEDKVKCLLQSKDADIYSIVPIYK